MYDFGLSEEQFWNLTPAQFSAISARFDSANERLDFRAGIIASTMANTCRSKEDSPFTPQMFMPNYDGEDTKATTEMSPESMLAHLKAAFPPRALLREQSAEVIDG